MEARLRARYLWSVEERNIWLPAGLESSGAEPDDRASHRSDARTPRRESKGPTASGTWEPNDPDRPESKRSRVTPDSGKAEPAARPQRTGKPAPTEQAGESPPQRPQSKL